jgi:hypothetical protein
MRWKAKILITVVVLLFCTNVVAIDWEKKSVPDAVKMGQKWGGKKALAGARKMFMRFYPWYWWYGSNSEAAELALTTWTESRGNPLARTKDSKLGEVGLLSVKEATSYDANVDPCSPVANIWTKSYYGEMRDQTSKTKYKWLAKYGEHETEMISAAIGGVGAGGVHCLVQNSGVKDNLQKIKSPFHFIMYWMRDVIGDGLKDPKYDYCWGRTSASQVAFRYTRVEATWKARIAFWGGGKKGLAMMKKCTRPTIEKPKNLPVYPGHAKYGICAKDDMPKKAWGEPPDYRKKATRHGLKDLWADYCPDHGLPCTYEAVYANWVDKKQAEGLLPSDDEYSKAKAEMTASGCWPPGL